MVTKQSIHEVEEGLQVQLTDEEQVWTIEVKDITATPASPTVVSVTRESNGANEKTTLMPTGNPSIVSTTKVQLPVLKSLTATDTYRVLVTFTDGGSNIHGVYVRIWCPM